MECLPNGLTPLYSKIYYKEENYLKVRTVLLIYPSPSIVKVEYIGTSVRLVRECVSTFSTFSTFSMWLVTSHVTQLPLVLWLH